MCGQLRHALIVLCCLQAVWHAGGARYATTNESTHPPTDLVICWAGLQTHHKPQDAAIEHDVGDDHGELRTNLQLTTLRVPWFRKIFVLQNPPLVRPSWLTDKVELVDRCQLFEDESSCPTFNTHACQSVAHRVPDLSEHFVLNDDDIFPTRNLSFSDYFDGPSRPRVFFNTTHPAELYVDDLAKDALGTDLPPAIMPKRSQLFSHLPTPLLKSFVERMEAAFPEWYRFVRGHKGRFTCCNASKHENGLEEDFRRIYPVYLQEWGMGSFHMEPDAFCDQQFPALRACVRQKVCTQKFVNVNNMNSNGSWEEVHKILSSPCQDNWWEIALRPEAVCIAGYALAVAAAAYLILFWIRHTSCFGSIQQSTSRPGALLAVAASLWFFLLSIAVDLCFKVNAEGNHFQQAQPVLTVLLAEACKLFMSLIILTCSTARTNAEEGRPAETNAYHTAVYRIALRLLPVAITYCTNNALTFYLLANMRFDSVLVWRSTNIIFTSILWTWIFKRPLGINSKLAVALCASACFINSTGADGVVVVDRLTPIALLQAATAGLGAALNERAFKAEESKLLSIDVINTMLYAQTTIMLLFTRLGQFFALGASSDISSLNPTAWAIIVMYACLGLCISRVLKYADAVTYSIVNGLRSPVTIYLASFWIHGTGSLHVAMLSGVLTGLSMLLNSTRLPEKRDGLTTQQ